MMRAGLLNRRLAVDQPVMEQQDNGEQVNTFEEFATVWARISPVRGREALINGANVADLDTKILVRRSPQLDTVTAEWRLRYKTTIYDIVSIAHAKIGFRQIEFLCKSGVNDG